MHKNPTNVKELQNDQWRKPTSHSNRFTARVSTYGAARYLGARPAQPDYYAKPQSGVRDRHFDQHRHRPALGELLLQLADIGVDIATIGQLYSEFNPGWPAVADWITKVKPQLNLAIRALRATMDPTAIVFGGEAPAALKDLLIAAYIASELPGAPSTIGAALLPLKDCVLM